MSETSYFEAVQNAVFDGAPGTFSLLEQIYTRTVGKVKMFMGKFI